MDVKVVIMDLCDKMVNEKKLRKFFSLGTVFLLVMFVLLFGVDGDFIAFLQLIILLLFGVSVFLFVFPPVNRFSFKNKPEELMVMVEGAIAEYLREKKSLLQDVNESEINNLILQIEDVERKKLLLKREVILMIKNKGH